MSFPQQIQDAQTVAIRVQVIEMEPFALDLIVPTYTPAHDITQRIARDAGLGAYWEDGTRRHFWLRARGRILADNERLQDLGVGSGELLHLLPQPRDAQIAEQIPEYPPNRGYPAAGWVVVATTLVLLLFWTGAWSAALVSYQGIGVSLLPGLGLSLLVTSFARHIWGGYGGSWKVPTTSIVMYFLFLAVAAIPVVALTHQDPQALILALVPAAVVGPLGVVMGWIAWMGPVEPLPRQVTRAAQQQAAHVTTCAVCQQPVSLDVRTDCTFQCGRVFHSGCYRAQQAMAAPGACGICGFQAG